MSDVNVFWKLLN